MFSQFRRKYYKCINSKNYNDLPIDEISDLDSNVFSCYTGPDKGICEIDLPNKKQTANLQTTDDYFESLIANESINWSKSHHRAYGISTSLYESNPVTKQTVGDPIADTYAILGRNNNCILLMADGVNWGVRSKRASRCAVRAALNYINKYLFFDNNNNNTNIRTTHDLFKIMSKAFDDAQEFIIKNEGSMTTLCCSVVIKLKDSSLSGGHDDSSSTHVVCTLSIGDSTAYVFSKEKGIFELTKGSRNVQNDRDIRDVGGALGYVYGTKPDLSNINYSIMYIKSNDIVFLVSDGISDNFDPCISGCARKKTSSINEINGDLPVMEPYERYLCSLNHMFEILMRNKTLNETISAQEVCAMLIEHVVKLTEPKRQLLENGFAFIANLNNDEEKLKFQIKLRDDALKLNGKLDHASIVAYEI